MCICKLILIGLIVIVVVGLGFATGFFDFIKKRKIKSYSKSSIIDSNNS